MKADSTVPSDTVFTQSLYQGTDLHPIVFKLTWIRGSIKEEEEQELVLDDSIVVICNCIRVNNFGANGSVESR